MTFFALPSKDHPPSDVSALYAAALADYVQGGVEIDLSRAFDCARLALQASVSIGELSEMHFRAAQAHPENPGRAEAFYLEAISVYDMALRGYGESVARLTQEVQERKRVEQELRDATARLAQQRDHLDSEVRKRTSELRARFEDLRHLNTQLQLSNSEQAQFTYAISHDLKSPVNTVAMMLDLLEGEPMTADARELVDAARLTTTRMAALIGDVLGYSALIGQSCTFEEVALATICAEALADLAPEIAAARARITVSDLPRVRGVPSQLRSLFHSLVSNALKFHTPDQPCQLMISALPAPKGCAVELHFKDNGIGIDSAFHERIFALFQRLHTYEEFPGSGVGLTLCQRIAGYHRGAISVRSRAGEGSCFIVRLWVEEG